jgi:hypothetical protein
MICKLSRLLYCVLLLSVNTLVAHAQSAKAALLNQVDSLPMPAKPEGSSLFITVNEQPEIIAMVQADFSGQLFRANAVNVSYIGKGKVVVFGPSAYFKPAMLDDKNVAQLIKNAINWAKPGPAQRNIAVTESIDKGFADFLGKQSANVYSIKNYDLKKGTDLLFLNKDVTDKSQLKLIENFITAGGTLMFASPYSDLYNSKDTIKDLRYLDLGINKLLAKAGLVNLNAVVVQSPKYTLLATDSIPAYLHIKTLLPLLQSGAEFSERSDFFINFTIDQALKYNDANSVIINKIKQSLKIPAVLPVPSPGAPVLNNTPALKAAAKIGYWLYAKQQDFDHHPQAKADGYKIFPGDVQASAARVTETVSIPVKVGTQGLNDPAPGYYRPHSTGLYVPAGEKVSITISGDDLKQHLKAQIGVHSDDVTHLDEFKRIPLNLTATFSLDKKQIDIYSPYGGLLLINIPDNSTSKTITVQVKGAVKAPYFKLGETSEQEWNTTIRNNPAPWAELATDNIVLTVPSYRIRNLNNPVKLMQFWDEVMDADADLAIIAKKRVHQERIIIDADLAYGYMFTDKDRIVSPDDQSCEWMLNEEFIRSHGSWGTFHELGHRHQFSPLGYPGTGEVTVNLFTMYVYDKVLHKGIYNHEGMETKELVINAIKNYLDNGPTYDKWCNDPFLALGMYIQIIDAFGWDAIKAAHTTYRNLPKDKYPTTDQAKTDLWFNTICKATNSNLSRFFEVWKVPVSDEAKKAVAGYKVWFPKELEGYK